MFNYLTNTNNLHNILWVYSPDQSRANRTTYYPGSSYVDIAALDVYVDDPVRYIVD
jgi:mannan endo-1,4-beta-mannosidase